MKSFIWFPLKDILAPLVWVDGLAAKVIGAETSFIFVLAESRVKICLECTAPIMELPAHECFLSFDDPTK